MSLKLFNKYRKKRFLIKSAKTVLVFTSSYDVLMGKLDDDIANLNQFKIVKETPIQQTSRLRTNRQQPIVKEEVIQVDVTNNEKLSDVVKNLNVYHIYSQLKIIKLFNSKYSSNIYVKYLFDGENIDEKLNNIEKKCNEVYLVGKSVIKDESALKLFEEGFIQTNNDLEAYKNVLKKYDE